MMNFTPTLPGDRPLRVLCLGAHADDIEIGCGGSMLELIASPRPLDIRWIVFSGNQARAEEARNSASFWLEGARSKDIVLEDFKDGFFPADWPAIKTVFEGIKTAFDPDIVFTHHRDDLHQDHRIVNELTWNTFRNHTVFEYEIPKYDGDLATPNFYVPLTEQTAKSKCENLVRFFNSQNPKHWFSAELFMGLMRIRGMECCAPSGYAEGFHCRKVLGSFG